jgi:hypothetical protein
MVDTPSLITLNGCPGRLILSYLPYTQCKNAMRKHIFSPTCILLIVSVALAVFAPYTLTIKLAAIASCHATWGFVLYFRPEGESPIEGRGQRLLWWSMTLLYDTVTLAMSVAYVLVLTLCHQHTPGWIIAVEVRMNGVIVPHATININCGSGITVGMRFLIGTDCLGGCVCNLRRVLRVGRVRCPPHGMACMGRPRLHCVRCRRGNKHRARGPELCGVCCFLQTAQLLPYSRFGGVLTKTVKL